MTTITLEEFRQDPVRFVDASAAGEPVQVVRNGEALVWLIGGKMPQIADNASTNLRLIRYAVERGISIPIDEAPAQNSARLTLPGKSVSHILDEDRG
jgi:antitoxin (DNA-binding transcriptional repressor) of toxin-antitoxin stability system